MEKAELKGPEGNLVIWREPEIGKTGVWVHALCCMNKKEFCRMSCPLLKITSMRENLSQEKFRAYKLECGSGQSFYEAYPGPKEIAVKAVEKLN